MEKKTFGLVYEILIKAAFCAICHQVFTALVLYLVGRLHLCSALSKIQFRNGIHMQFILPACVWCL